MFTSSPISLYEKWFFILEMMLSSVMEPFVFHAFKTSYALPQLHADCFIHQHVYRILNLGS